MLDETGPAGRHRGRWPTGVGHLRRTGFPLLSALLLVVLIGCGGEPAERAVGPDEPGTVGASGEEATVDNPASSPDVRDDVERTPAQPPGPGEMRHESADVGGGEQPYAVYVPAQRADPAALVVLLHGPTPPSTTVLEAELAKSGLAPVVDQEGFVVALPAATGETWKVARTEAENEAQVPWLTGFGVDSFAQLGWEYGDEDAQVIMAVVDAVVSAFEVDESRVYVVGVQNGSLKAARMVCDKADRFAALAAMTNGLMMTDPCPAQRPVPAIGTGGADNPLQTVDLMEQGARLWANHNGCEPEPSVSQIAEQVTELRWNGCHATSAVVAHRIAGVRYEFVPGRVQQIEGYLPAEAIWGFLSEYTLP